MSKKILLVEDDFDIREVYTMMLQDTGYSVTQAKDGEEALALVAKDTYDLIILDIMIPKINGLEVLKQLRAEGSPWKQIPVLMASNLGHEYLIKDALVIGVEGYIVKAKLNLDEFILEVKKVLKEIPAS